MLLYRWVISRYVIGQFSVHKLLSPRGVGEGTSSTFTGRGVGGLRLKGVPFLGFRDIKG